jgi:hypothetical protein
MDELDNLAHRAEAFEKGAAAANSWEPVDDKKEQGAGVIAALPPIDAAGNRAESVLKVLAAAAKMFVDDRLEMSEAEIQNGRDSLAPVIQKYNLAGEGTGRLPYQEELTAGFYIGGLIKRFMRAVATLRAYDKAKAQADNQANNQPNNQANYAQGQANGEERKHQSEKQSQPVSSEVGGGKVTNPNEEVWDMPDGAARSIVG